MNSALPIGVCSWSIDRHDPRRAMQVAANDLDLRVVQLGFFAREVVDSADPIALSRTAAEVGVTICGIFVAFEGEDYSSIESIPHTGGLMPDDPYPQRLETFRRAVRLAAEMVSSAGGAAGRSVAIHAGTILDSTTSVDYSKLRVRAREFADVCAEKGLRLVLETGREPAETLSRFIGEMQRPNVGVNFDPANFIIYGTDDPVKALTQLKPLIELVHLKDATRATAVASPAQSNPQSSQAFGSAAAFGQGDVQIPRVVSKLRAAGYAGPLLVETPERAGVSAIREAGAFLRSMF